MKVLITGLGSIGQRHARCLRRKYGNGIEIHGYRSRRLRQIIHDDLTMTEGDPAAEYGIIEHRDLDSALEADPQAVFITNPPDLHVDTALRAAECGCHLFIEKPVAQSLNGLDELIRVVDDGELVCLVGQQFRFHPFTSAFKRTIDANTLGEISSAEFIFKEYLPGMHPYEDYRLSHASHEERGGGVILSLNHYLDIICLLFGDPLEVVCFGGQNGNLGIEAEDTAAILLNYRKENGRLCTVTVLLDFIKRPRQMEWHLTAERGSLFADFQDNVLRRTDHGEGRTSEETDLVGFERNSMFMDEHAEFFGMISGEDVDERLPGLVESKSVLDLTLKIRESMQARTIINVSR